MTKKIEPPKISPEEQIKLQAKKREEQKAILMAPLYGTKLFKSVEEECLVKRDGPPYTVTPKTLEDLFIIYLADGTDEMACAYAQIASSSLYDFQKRHPEFSEWKQAWKLDTLYRAKMTVRNNISNPDVAQWILERHPKTKLDYSKSPDIVINNNMMLPQSSREAKIAEKLLRANEDYAERKPISSSKDNG